MTTNERAAQIWPVLAYAAAHHQVIEYDKLGQLIGVPRQGIGQLLEPIQSYCLVHEHPALTVLVVSGRTGIPGTGFFAAQDVPGEQMRVFKTIWSDIGCPTPEEFAAAAKEVPPNGSPEISNLDV